MRVGSTMYWKVILPSLTLVLEPSISENFKLYLRSLSLLEVCLNSPIRDFLCHRNSMLRRCQYSHSALNAITLPNSYIELWSRPGPRIDFGHINNMPKSTERIEGLHEFFRLPILRSENSRPAEIFDPKLWNLLLTGQGIDDDIRKTYKYERSN